MNNIFISTGNSKIKNCNIFSLPSGITCRSDVNCRVYCYAKKSEYCYKNVLPRRNENFRLSKHKNFVSNITNILKNRLFKITRIHESGDFYSQRYLLKWYDICNELSRMRFYAYTKRHDIITKKLLKYKPSNLTLIYSIDGLREIHNANLTTNVRLESATKLYEGYNKVAIVNSLEYHNCEGSVAGNIKCIKDCKLCIDSESEVIIFKKH